MFFNEDLLHYIWKFRLYSQKDLCTSEGISLKVISPGIQQGNAGPDFQNARLQIGETEWAGNVEIHIRSSDWLRHGHEKDAAYGNVVLHVVYKNDRQICNAEGFEIPVLILENLVSEELLLRYQNLLYENVLAFPCEKVIRFVDGFTVKTWLDRMLVQRLEEKLAQIKETVGRLNGNWEEAFYQVLAANFGFKVNALAFEMLARCTPLPLVAKYRFDLLQTEALLFGQAGFLDDDLDDSYYLELQKEYRFLKQKHGLTALDKYLWKFLRLRPPNFPTVRLAQFAALMHRKDRFFAEIIQADLTAIHALFIGINPSAYWLEHYHFGKTSKPCPKTLGKSSVENILINTVGTFLFAYGKENMQEKLTYKAVNIIESLPCENNIIISNFSSAGMKLRSAADSQAAIELKTKYCDKKRCLECGIGHKILKSN